MAGLTKKQELIIEDIEDILKKLKEWEGLSAEECISNNNFQLFLSDFDSEILKAVKNGLETHPLVEPRYTTLRVLGEWNYLRKGKEVRAESGVKKPLSETDMNLHRDISIYRTQGKRWESIRRILIGEGKLKPGYSKQAFYKLRKKLLFI